MKLNAKIAYLFNQKHLEEQKEIFAQTKNLNGTMVAHFLAELG